MIFFDKIKIFESLRSGFFTSEKKKSFLVLGVAHGDPIFAKVGLKNGYF